MATSSQSLRFWTRIGRCLVAPSAAMRASALPDNTGRAPIDFVVLVMTAFVAAHVSDLITVFHVGWGGELATAIQMMVLSIARDFSLLLVALLVAAVGLTLAAGRRRSFGLDFDLVCVAFVPAVATYIFAALVRELFAPEGSWLAWVTTLVAYGWVAVHWGLALRCARARVP